MLLAQSCTKSCCKNARHTIQKVYLEVFRAFGKVFAQITDDVIQLTVQTYIIHIYINTEYLQQLLCGIHSVIHFWHAPLRVHSTKRRHQSPEWAILSQVDCFVQGQVKQFQVLLDSLHPRGVRA